MTWTLPGRLDAQTVLTPAHEAQRLLSHGGWTAVPARHVADLLGELRGSELARMLDAVGLTSSRCADPRTDRARLLDAVRPAPEGRGTLTLLARVRPVLDGDRVAPPRGA